MLLPTSVSTILRYSKLKFSLQENFELSLENIKKLRELEYINQWKLAFNSNWFHIKFEDHSLITFQNNPSPSFQYLECPLDVPTLGEYITNTGRTPKDKHSSIFQEEFEMVFDTAELRSNTTPMRYDYDEKSYRAGVHPVAHLHIGINNQIRIGLDREMNPISFLLFVIRQRYPANWENILKSSFEKNLLSLVRNSLPVVAQKYKAPFDTNELVFC